MESGALHTSGQGCVGAAAVEADSTTVAEWPQGHMVFLCRCSRHHGLLGDMPQVLLPHIPGV